MFQMTQTHGFREAKKLQTKYDLTYQEAQRSQERTRSPVPLTAGFFHSYY